jgi:hypothetical protein
MLDKRYYEGWNKNDNYEIKPEILLLLEELEGFDTRLKKFLGPKKVKDAGVDARRHCRNMEAIIKRIKKKIQMTKQDYESNYEDD